MESQGRTEKISSFSMSYAWLENEGGDLASRENVQAVSHIVKSGQWSVEGKRFQLTTASCA
jgi:hypothetical protein